MPPRSELLPEIIEWAQSNKLEAILSNRNYFDDAAIHLTNNADQLCRYVPLDADERTRAPGGIYQNHPVIGERSVDMVVGQIKTFRRDQEESVSLNMVHPTWLPLTDWKKGIQPPETVASHP